MLQQKNYFFLVLPTSTIDRFLTFIILYVGQCTIAITAKWRQFCYCVHSSLELLNQDNAIIYLRSRLSPETCMSSVWLLIAAHWGAVQPNSPTLSIGIPSSNKRTTLLTSPHHAARVNLSMSRKLISVEEINVQTKFFPFSETRLHHSLCSII